MIWRLTLSAITAQQLPTAAKNPVNADKLNSILVLLDRYGDRIGPDQLHRAVQ
jgi:hypothetical protein